MKRSFSFPFFFLLFFLSMFARAEAATDLEPIVVRHLPYGSAGDAAATAVVTREEIARSPARTPEALLGALGVDVQARGAAHVKSDISLNASTFQQVLILVNGVRVKDSQTSHHDLDLFFSLDDVERVEIIPAAQSLKYGPDGIAGAVNFVLKKPAAEKNQISASGGTHETYGQSIGLSHGLLGAKNRFSFANATSAGSRYDRDYRSDTFFHSSVWEGEKTSFYLDGGYNEKEFGAYDFYTPNRGYPSKEWTNTKFVDARAVVKGDRFTFEPRLDFRQHHDKFMLDIRQPSLSLNHHTTNTYEAGGRLSLPQFIDKVDLGLGADYGSEQIVSGNLGKHIRGRWDLYLDPTFELSPMSTLNATARIDSSTSFGEDFTGSLSLKHALDEKNDVYISAGRTMRIPTFTELYYTDPTTAGNADLSPEHALNAEVGWKTKLTETFSGSLAFFLRHETDSIDFTKLAASDPQFIARNITKATTPGLNAYLKWVADDKTSFDLRYLYANKMRKASGLIFKYGLSHVKHMLDVGMDKTFSFGRNRVDMILKKKPCRREWVVVNDRFSVDVKKGLEVFFEATNLFNVEFQEIDGIPDEGRLLKAGVKYSW